MKRCVSMWSCVKNFFTYETTKSVVVKSWTIGIINRIVQLIIISYFVGGNVHTGKIWCFFFTPFQGKVMFNCTRFLHKPADYGDFSSGLDFLVFSILVSTFVFCCPCVGIPTGRCVPFNSNVSSCEIKGWCPAEIDTIKTDPMEEVKNFTIFIKNSIRFPTFDYTKGNFLPSMNETYIKKCNFNMGPDIYCPIFKVGDILNYAQQNFTELAAKGGVIGIKINWMCDLDKSDDYCNPSYSFTRLDAMSQKSTVSPGYNFRFAKYYKMENGTDYRTLIKAYAIRFDVIVNGNAGKFNMIPTLINMVAAFTSVGVGTVLCDIILLNFLKGAEQYKAKKFEEVKLLYWSYRARVHYVPDASLIRAASSSTPVVPNLGVPTPTRGRQSLSVGRQDLSTLRG
uniref:P2X purinoceptor n=1 Tax=Nothobranchius furzeri TaxID=105023 RepID=A0A8C6LW37_NOTFU